MRVLRALGGFVLLILFLWALLPFAVYAYGRRDESRAADAIVVLGAAQYDGRPSPVLRARLDHAIELYEQGVAPTLIFTGGVGVGDTVSEAEVGGRYARKAGVPRTSILLERGGLGSYESMAGVARLMRSHDLGSAVLVSDPFHMLRLRILAAYFGVTAYSSPTRSSPIRRGTLEEWKHVLREAAILPFALFEAPHP